MRRTCQHVSGCNREATRLFAGEPVNGWLCEEYSQQALDSAAELESNARRKFDAEWREHFEKYLRKHNLNPEELTEAQARQILDEMQRWVQHKGRTVREPEM
jgi:hypothetical protein